MKRITILEVILQAITYGIQQNISNPTNRLFLQLVEQEPLTLQEHLSSPHPRFLVGFMLLDLQFHVYVLQIVMCPFVPFLLAIVLSVLRYTDSSNYPLGIFTETVFLISSCHKNLCGIQPSSNRGCLSENFLYYLFKNNFIETLYLMN